MKPMASTSNWPAIRLERTLDTPMGKLETIVLTKRVENEGQRDRKSAGR